MCLLSGVSAFPHKKVTIRLKRVAFCALLFEIRYCFHFQGRKVGLRSPVQPLFPSYTEPLPPPPSFYSTPMMEAACPSETTRRHIPWDRHLYFQLREPLVCHSLWWCLVRGWGVMAFRDCERNLIIGLYLKSGRSNIILSLWYVNMNRSHACNNMASLIIDGEAGFYNCGSFQLHTCESVRFHHWGLIHFHNRGSPQLHKYRSFHLHNCRSSQLYKRGVRQLQSMHLCRITLDQSSCITVDHTNCLNVDQPSCGTVDQSSCITVDLTSCITVD